MKAARYADSHATSYDEGLDWRQLAACKDADPDLFFGPEGERAGPDQMHREAEAKTFCRRCVSREACLTEALATKPGKDFGIRGGLDEKERAALRRRAARG